MKEWVILLLTFLVVVLGLSILFPNVVQTITSGEQFGNSLESKTTRDAITALEKTVTEEEFTQEDYETVKNFVSTAEDEEIEEVIGEVAQTGDTATGEISCLLSMESDFDENGEVDIDDVVAVILNWGACSTDEDQPCDLDINGDQIVGEADLEFVILNFGPVVSCCGNGEIDIELGEECDDGNTNDNDGCNSSCNLEIGLACGNLICEEGEEISCPQDCANFVEICTVEDLNIIREDLSGSYLQVCDIDLENQGFEPIGHGDASIGEEFSGVYDGNGYSIMNFEYLDLDRDYTGFFGATSGAVLKNINLLSFNVSGKEKVGGLSGKSRGDVFENINADGFVFGQHYVGGMVGELYNSQIINSSAFGSVNSFEEGLLAGAAYTGGMVGYFAGGESSIVNSFSEGSVQSRGGQNFVGSNSNSVYTGGLIGYMVSGKISDSYSTKKVRGDQYVGGLIGQSLPGSIIENSYATGEITASLAYPAGLIGHATGTIINNSYASGGIVNCSSDFWQTGNSFVGCSQAGGLVGAFGEGSYIENSYSEKDVYALLDYNGIDHGGLIGRATSSQIFESYSLGNVFSPFGSSVGGFAGDVFDGVNITNSYAQGNVVGEQKVGGFVGIANQASNIVNSYSTGNVSGSIDVGGFSGLSNGAPSVLFSYWDIDTSMQSQSTEGEGKTTEEMFLQSTYENWDFDNVWEIEEGINYPKLKWQNN